MHPLVDQLGLLDLKPVGERGRRRGGEGEGEKEREGGREQRKVKFVVAI